MTAVQIASYPKRHKRDKISWKRVRSKHEDPFSNFKIHAFGQNILSAHRLVLLYMPIHDLFILIYVSFTLPVRAVFEPYQAEPAEDIAIR